MALEYAGFTFGATLLVAVLGARRRYAVVQVHNPPDFLAAVAVIPKLLGASVVLDVHDLSPDMFAMRFEGRRGARVADLVLRAVEQSAAFFADEVVTVHEPYRRELVDRGVPAAKTTVVMNAVDESVLPSRADQPRGGEFRVFYHGTITPSYGVELIVEAAGLVAPDVPDLRVELYGEGDALAGIQARAAELGIGNLLLTSGRYLPQREVLMHAREASVGVIPNLPTTLNRFALSSKLFEYVALGIPVVSADLPTIQAHFSADELRFFRAGDPVSLAEALLDVAQDPEQAAARAEAARTRYAEYEWSSQLRRYLNVLSRASGAHVNAR